MFTLKNNNVYLTHRLMVTIFVKAKQKEWEDNMDNILPEMDARSGVNILCRLLPCLLCFLRCLCFCFH